MQIFSVFVGGMLGALSRVILGNFLSQVSPGFPLGTLAVNLIGCFLLGLFWGLLQRFALAKHLQMGIATGFIGSLTTFSTFSVDFINLAQKSLSAVSIYWISNVLGGLTLTLSGLWLGEKLSNHQDTPEVMDN